MIPRWTAAIQPHKQAETEFTPLDSAVLSKPCDPSLFDFETTAEVQETFDVVGQTRAEEALALGIEIKHRGYNVFVTGEPGSGRHAFVLRLLRAHARKEPVPSDWCYVNNFGNTRCPKALALPPARGAALKKDMDQFVVMLGGAISNALAADEYRARIEMLQEEFKKKHEVALQSLAEEALRNDVALVQGPQGLFFVPARNKEAIAPEDFAKLPEAEQKALEKAVEDFTEKLEKLSRQFPRWQQAMQNQVREIRQTALRMAVGHLIEDLQSDYRDLPEVISFLDQILTEIVKAGETPGNSTAEDDSESGQGGRIHLQPFRINLIVDRSGLTEAPVIYEDNPNLQNLFGRFDQIAHFGSLVTNFSMVRGGALHRANGGYLVLDADKLLTQPFAYEELKRTLKSGKLQIQAPGQLFGIMSTVTLEPEPIPLNVKIVLIGDRRSYYLLKQLDPEFDDLFKVAGDFEADLERTDTMTRSYARVITHLIRANQFRAFRREAVARMIEHASRLTGDAERLTAQTRWITDLMSEANHRADREKAEVVQLHHIDEALAARAYRANRVRDIMEREVVRETLLIATAGKEIGQINGLAVVDMPDKAFAHPVRITANIWQGRGGIIDIEREAELGGNIHSKGVMILTSFLAARFARRAPLALGASLVFEQSYGPVEGDSASLAELCALLSALSGVAITQSIAVTGSINQHGRVQAIGGVNEKIEGFFDLCKRRGLAGDQGVLIPDANVKHLMLRPDVVRSCHEGKFHVYAVDTVDHAIELLTGISAGSFDDKGIAPPGTINGLIQALLQNMWDGSHSQGQDSVDTE
ncbi:MAG: AAA family ATPase [Leptospirales bacterium]|nr:AAA family ATPase [Leptospirales bacterium]